MRSARSGSRQAAYSPGRQPYSSLSACGRPPVPREQSLSPPIKTLSPGNKQLSPPGKPAASPQHPLLNKGSNLPPALRARVLASMETQPVTAPEPMHQPAPAPLPKPAFPQALRLFLPKALTEPRPPETPQPAARRCNQPPDSQRAPSVPSSDRYRCTLDFLEEPTNREHDRVPLIASKAACYARRQAQHGNAYAVLNGDAYVAPRQLVAMMHAANKRRKKARQVYAQHLASLPSTSSYDLAMRTVACLTATAAALAVVLLCFAADFHPLPTWFFASNVFLAVAAGMWP